MKQRMPSCLLPLTVDNNALKIFHVFPEPPAALMNLDDVGGLIVDGKAVKLKLSKIFLCRKIPALAVSIDLIVRF